MLDQTIQKVFCGALQSFLLKSNGEVWVFGDNRHGSLGVPFKECPNPTLLMKDRLIRSVHSGKYHTLFLKNSGVLLGCGSNLFSQLGLEEREVYYEPTLILHDPSITQVHAGINFSLLLNRFGELTVYGHFPTVPGSKKRKREESSYKLKVNEPILSLFGSQEPLIFSFQAFSCLQEEFQVAVFTFLLCQTRVISAPYRLPKPLLSTVLSLSVCP